MNWATLTYYLSVCKVISLWAPGCKASKAVYSNLKIITQSLSCPFPPPPSPKFRIDYGDKLPKFYVCFHDLISTSLLASTMPHVTSYQVTISSPSFVLTSSNSYSATWPLSPHEWLWLVKNSKVRHPSKSRGMVQSTTSVRLSPSLLRSGAKWSITTSFSFQLGMNLSPQTSPWSLLHPRMLLKYRCWFRYVL